MLDEDLDAVRSDENSLQKDYTRHFPLIYTEAPMEGVAVRFRQQVAENAKMLSSHHVIPEMNHNELVGWRTPNEDLSVVFVPFKRRVL